MTYTKISRVYNEINDKSDDPSIDVGDAVITENGDYTPSDFNHQYLNNVSVNVRTISPINNIISKIKVGEKTLNIISPIPQSSSIPLTFNIGSFYIGFKQQFDSFY